MAYFVTPVTILAGFLGSGKTTLVNRFLREAHGKRFAVIENEFGEVSIDDDLVYRDTAEVVVQLTNGCVCCRVRGDLARGLEQLALRRALGELTFDHVLIETSGLADPSPIIQTFMAETTLLTRYALDGVVTLVDCLNLPRTLVSANEALAQIALADRILLTKADRVDAVSREAVEQRVRGINGVARLHALDLTAAPWDEIFARLLDIRGYEFDRVAFDIDPAASPRRSRFSAEPVAANHTPAVVCVSFRTSRSLDPIGVQAAFATLRRTFGDRIWRMKGILSVAGHPKRIVVQGVHDFLQVNTGSVWRPFEERETKLVVIGPGLDRNVVLDAFEKAAAWSGSDADTPLAV